MDREGFRNRLKQYKKAREENPGLKYWEWRNAVSTEENPIYYSELEDLNSQLSEIEPLLNERKNIEQTLLSKRLELSEKYKVPYLKDKEITLTNAGSMTGTRLTTNLLDSIAKYANKTGLPLLEAIGLAALETTFGQNIRLFDKIHNNSNYDDYYVEDVLSDWRYKSRDVNEYLEKKLNAPSAEAARLQKESFDYTMSKTKRMSAEEYEKALILSKRALLLQAKDLIDFIIKYYNDFEKSWSDYEKKTVPPFEHAFQYYKTGKYNSGDPTHTPMVKQKGAEVMLSPEFKNWFKSIPKYDEGGQVEPDPLEVLERSKPKVAGIPINDKPLSGTDPLAELYLNLVSGNAVRKAVKSGIDGTLRKSMYNEFKELMKAGWSRKRAYEYALPELGVSVLPDIAKGFDYAIKGANYFHAANDFIK